MWLHGQRVVGDGCRWLPGTDVERAVDLEDCLDVQLLPGSRAMSPAQEDGIPPHDWQEHTEQRHQPSLLLFFSPPTDGFFFFFRKAKIAGTKSNDHGLSVLPFLLHQTLGKFPTGGQRFPQGSLRFRRWIGKLSHCPWLQGRQGGRGNPSPPAPSTPQPSLPSPTSPPSSMIVSPFLHFTFLLSQHSFF